MLDFGHFDINNSIPTINNVSILPLSPTVEDSLNCSVNISDSNDIIQNVSFTWYVNGIQNDSFDTNVTCDISQGLCYTDVLFTNLETNYNYTCSARSYDGTNFSDWMNSTQVMVGNTPPTINLSYPSYSD